MCMMQGGRSLCLMSAIVNGRYEDSPLCVCRYVMVTTTLSDLTSLTIVECVNSLRLVVCEYSERCLWCELLSVHTPRHTHPHTHSPPRSPAGKGWVRSNRNPRDLKMTDEQRQVETASSPSQIIKRWQQSLMSNSGGTIITRAHYHNKPSTPTHILTHEQLVSSSPAGSGIEQWVLMMCQSVAVSVSTITASVGNPVASGTCFCACVFISTVLLRNTFCVIIAQEPGPDLAPFDQESYLWFDDE